MWVLTLPGRSEVDSSSGPCEPCPLMYIYDMRIYNFAVLPVTLKIVLRDRASDWIGVCYCCQAASVVSDSVRSHRRQLTRLPCPWDSPEHWSGLPFPSPMRESEVAQSCPTLSDPMDCSPPGSPVPGILQNTGVGCHFLLQLHESEK